MDLPGKMKWKNVLGKLGVGYKRDKESQVGSGREQESSRRGTLKEGGHCGVGEKPGARETPRSPQELWGHSKIPGKSCCGISLCML